MMQTKQVAIVLVMFMVLVWLGSQDLPVNNSVSEQEKTSNTEISAGIECVIDQIIEKHNNGHLKTREFSLTEWKAKKPSQKRKQLDKLYNLYQSGINNPDDSDASQLYLVYPSGTVSLVESSSQWNEDKPLPNTVILISHQLFWIQLKDPTLGLKIMIYTFDTDSFSSPLERGDFKYSKYLDFMRELSGDR